MEYEPGYSTEIPTGALVTSMLVALIVGILLTALMFWKVFSKAGYAGWKSIIPIYNIYILCKIAGRPGWWVILMLIPLVNLVVSIIVSLDVAKSFGKGPAFGIIGLWLFGIIGYPILGFGSARYLGPAAEGGQQQFGGPQGGQYGQPPQAPPPPQGPYGQ